MQILGLLLIFLIDAQNGRSSRSGERTEFAIIGKADGKLSRKSAHGTVYGSVLDVAPMETDSQDAEHASNEKSRKTAPNQHKVIKLSLEAGKVTVVLSDFSIFESSEPIIVWESGFEKWDQSKHETRADDEHGVSSQALNYAWQKSKPFPDYFIVAKDLVPVKEEVEDLFFENHLGSTPNIFFLETAQAVDQFNKAREDGRSALIMLSLGRHSDAKEPHAIDQPQGESFGRATAYPNIAFVAFSMALSFSFTGYR